MRTRKSKVSKGTPRSVRELIEHLNAQKTQTDRLNALLQFVGDGTITVPKSGAPEGTKP